MKKTAVFALTPIVSCPLAGEEPGVFSNLDNRGVLTERESRETPDFSGYPLLLVETNNDYLCLTFDKADDGMDK